VRNNAETNRRAAPSFEKFLYYPRTLADRYASNGAGGNAGTHSARTRSVRSASGTRQRKTLKARERESERERERGGGGEETDGSNGKLSVRPACLLAFIARRSIIRGYRYFMSRRFSAHDTIRETEIEYSAR